MIKIESQKALTKRQAQVLNLYKKNKTVKEIAKLLGVTTITIYATLKSARTRLGHTGRLIQRPKLKQSVQAEAINNTINNTIIINGEVYLRRVFVLTLMAPLIQLAVKP